MHTAIFRYGILLVLAALGASAAIAQTDLSFAAGVDSTGQALAQSNADGYVLIESLEYPRGLWLELVDEAGQPLAGLQVEYQGRPDSLVAIRCVDPVGSVRETLIWTRSEGDSLHLVLKPKEADDLPVGLTSIDWQIDPIVASLLEPEEETHLTGWEAVAAFLRARWQEQAGRVPVQLSANTNTSLAVEVAHPETVETLVAHLQQIYRPTGTPLGESAVLGVQVFRFRGGSALQEGVILYSSLFADANLEKAVREALGRPQGRLRVMDVADLTEFQAAEKFISSLVGFENFTALQLLILPSNQIADVSPLTDLTNLDGLFLQYNRITNVGPLAGLANLQRLDLDHNRIADVGSLAGLTNLQRLNLDHNRIADVGSLAGLTNLQRLNLEYNRIADVGPLAGLTNLHSLRLSSNQITDVGPLANLTNLQRLNLRHNRITDAGPLTNLTDLYDLFLPYNRITDAGPLAGLTNLIGLSLAGNQIANVGPLVGLTNLNHLWLSSNQITNVEPLASLAKLKTLGLDNNPIADVGPLAGLTRNLLSLRLSQTRITDVGPLAGLTNLYELHLAGNQIANVGPLADLTDLYYLGLSSNQITDIEPLANLTELRVLDIEDNQIEDLAPLVANTGLSEGDIVRLTGNPLSDQARNKHIPALQARGVEVEVHF